jgi:uncharacterized protein Yka (UPF0111/DUF47 family)
MEELQKWLEAGASGRCETVRALEKEADQIGIEIEQKLVDTFITPIDREDIYDLSDRLDDVIDGAKMTVREVEALEIHEEDHHVKEIAAALVEGTRCLVNAVDALQSNLPLATEQATLARRSENRVTKLYRQAMRELFALDDLKKIQKTKELYNSFLEVGKRIEVAAVKLLHVIVKIR